MSTIVIIPCGGRKIEGKAKASELYIGSYFKVNLRYARSIAKDEDIFILSALYGFLPLNKRVETYDLRMGRPSTEIIDKTRKQADKLGILNKKAVILGGKNYVDCCRDCFKTPYVLTEHLELKGMGYQMQWATRNIGLNPFKRK